MQSEQKSLSALLAPFLILPLGCGTPPEPTGPLPVPPLDVVLTHFSGTPLTGPTAGAVPSSSEPDDALRLAVALFALEAIPTGPFESLEAQARWIAVPGVGSPVEASAVLARGSRLAEPAEAESFLKGIAAGDLGRNVLLARLQGALPQGVTASLRATESRSAGSGPPRSAEVLVHRTEATGDGAALQIALVLEGERSTAELEETESGPGDGGSAPSGETSPETAAEPPSPPPRAREIVLLDRSLQSDPYCLALFFSAPGLPDRALAAVMEIGTPEWEGPAARAHRDTLERCWAQVRRAAGDAPESPPLDELAPAIRASLPALRQYSHQRGTLVFLAGATNARLAEDVAMTASRPLITDLAAAILGEALTPEDRDDRTRLGWIIERAAYRLVLEELSGDGSQPDLDALLTRHAGQAGRQPAILEDILRSASDLADFEERLVRANRIFLEDTFPSTRVRSYDWLAARNRHPEGYDPLADRTQRRAALERAAREEAEETTATGDTR